MDVLICGDRDWRDRKTIYNAVSKLDPENDFVIHGTQRGADSIGEEAAKRYRIPYAGIPPLWEKYGKAAGPMRNRRMLRMFDIDEIWAFHSDLEGKSKGTKDMVELGKRNNIKVVIYDKEKAN